MLTNAGHPMLTNAGHLLKAKRGVNIPHWYGIPMVSHFFGGRSAI